MNCRTCAHNRRVLVLASGDPSGGYVNGCEHPALIAFEATTEGDPAFILDLDSWQGSQEWDEKCMCPLQTDPCPGYEAP